MKKSWDNAKRWVWQVVRTAVVVAVIAAVAYAVKFAPVAVESHIIERGSIVAEVMGTGTLEARVGATISPKIAGRIERVAVDQGDRIEAADLLVQLDDEELQQQVAIAQANLDAAAAAIQRLKSDKSRAIAVYEQAKTSHDRAQKLVGQNAVSREEADRAVESLAVATSDVSRTEAAITEGQKELVAGEKTLEYHRARLQDTQILAPFDGLIIKRQREPGDVVVPGSSILTLVSTDELWISAWVDETEMSRLHPDQTARVVFRSEPDKSYQGTVIRLGKEADRETREFVVDVRVLELPKNWAVGQRAEAYIEVARQAETLLLPARFLSIREGRQSGVFVAVDGVARWRAVTIGLRSREQVEVLDGLAVEDVVVKPVDERKALANGKRVAIP